MPPFNLNCLKTWFAEGVDIEQEVSFANFEDLERVILIRFEGPECHCNI